MTRTTTSFLLILLGVQLTVRAGERTVVSLRDMSAVEVKSAGIDVPQPVSVHVKALGAGGSYGWTYQSDDLFAYGWIINADTREIVWKMDVDNTSRSRDNRSFEGTIQLGPGSYEVYFAACTFTYHTMFTHIGTNVDHRNKPLFGPPKVRNRHFFSFFSDWFSNDISKDWKNRSGRWGIDLLVDDSQASLIRTFTPPKEMPRVVFKAVNLGDNAFVRQSFALSEPVTLHVYALGEEHGGNDLVDFAWIVNARDRSRVWDMQQCNRSSAGGASKNIECTGDVDLEKGEYVMYYVTDDSHSAADWNAASPADPLNYGITISATDERGVRDFHTVPYKEDQNVIVSMTKVRDNENRSEGFTLKQNATVRIYAFGERSNAKRLMADYGYIQDAKTRNKVWSMDVDRTYHAGGSTKNRFVEEVISLPKGSYIVNYVTDDSHAYDAWNDTPPFDPEHYGITIMGVGEEFTKGIVTRYVEERDKNIIARITRVGDNADKEERFKLDRTSRVRIYAIGEGQNREMVDYGWIEDAKTNTVVWEMTYGMTFHAGGARKNRMVNTSILLDKGDYKLHFRTDDSHSYRNWNVDPPEDQEYYGITLYRDEAVDVTPPPAVPPAHAVPPIPPGGGRR